MSHNIRAGTAFVEITPPASKGDKKRLRAKRMAEQRERFLDDQLVRVFHGNKMPNRLSMPLLGEYLRKRRLIQRELATPSPLSDEARERRAIRLIRKFYRVP